MIRVHSLGDEISADILPKLTAGALQRLVVDLAAAARSHWIGLAQKELKSSRRAYVQGIQGIEVGKGYAAVSLVGLIPNLVENGQNPYDMHTTLLGPGVPLATPGKSGKRRAKDGHYYRAIPFRHQVPGTLGQGGGQVMGSAYQGHAAIADAAALGRSIHKHAQKLGATTGMPGQATKWGDRLPAGLAPKLRAHHSTDIYAGMVKMAKAYKEVTQNQYMTFRMISEAVPEKWHHPGIESRHLAPRVQRYIDGIAGKAALALVKGS